MSEVNRDGAELAMEVSKKELCNGNYDAALRYAEKAARMYPSENISSWLAHVKSQQRPSAQKTEPPVRTKMAHNVSGGEKNTTSDARQKANYTPEQAAQVKKPLSINRDDYYAVLGVPKGADEAEIKKAYRKVSFNSYNHVI